LLAITPALTKGQTVNEEQKAWVEKMKALIATAETSEQKPDTQSNYETLVDGVQNLVDEAPEP
jgi:hypothetical protein